MPVYEKRFWDRGYRGGGRNVYALGINTDTWELQVRYIKFWRGQLKEIGTFSVAEFLERRMPEGPKRVLQRALADLQARAGLEAARDTL